MATYYGKKYKLLELRHRVKEVILATRIALKSNELGKPVSRQPLHVAMVDGESFHGGMCDRFKGIISLYAYCKYRSLPFRIRYTYPFKLEDYLSLPFMIGRFMKGNIRTIRCIAESCICGGSIRQPAS